MHTRASRRACPGTRHFPLKRQRKLGIRDKDGKVIAFTRMPRVANLPREWRLWSPAEKIEHLLGMSLDRAAEILTWPMAELDPLRLSLWMQVWRVVFMIGVKAMLNGTLAREADRVHNRAAVLDELARRFDSAAPEA